MRSACAAAKYATITIGRLTSKLVTICPRTDRANGAAISAGHATSAMTSTLPTASNAATIAKVVAMSRRSSVQRGEAPETFENAGSNARIESSLNVSTVVATAIEAAAANVQMDVGSVANQDASARDATKIVSSEPNNTHDGSRSTCRAPCVSRRSTPSAKNAVKTMPSAVEAPVFVARVTTRASKIAASPAHAAPPSMAHGDRVPVTR